MYNKMIQLYLCIPFFRFFSLLGYKILCIILLYYTIGLCWLSILYIIVYICESQTLNKFISLLLISLFYFEYNKFVFYVCGSVFVLHISLFVSFLKIKVEFYSAIKKNEVMPLAVTWLVLEIIILNEVSQTEKDKYHMMLLKCVI